jgi:outer membrane usher protein
MPSRAAFWLAIMQSALRVQARGVCFFVARACVALVCASAGTAMAAPAGLQKLQLEVFIDGASTNLIAEILRAPDGRFSARRSELRELGIKAPGSGKDDDVIAFETIPGFGMRYDEPTQKLHLTLSPESRLAREYNAREANGLVLKPEIGISREYGSVLNYNLFGTAARGYGSGAKMFTTGAVTLDHRLFSPYGVIENSAIGGTTLTRQGLLRLESSYTYAHHSSSTLITAGDAISGGLAWTRPIRFGGGRISRQFSLRPDLVTAPMPSVSGSAAVPSTVDVYVDNMRIASQEVSSGPFRISNLPVPGESGTARVVVRDISGKETVTSVPFFTSPKLLSAGQFDYSLDAGAPRQNYAVESFDYSKRIMGMGSARYGFNDRFTFEGHAETTKGLMGGGIGATFSAGPIGLFSVAGAASRFREKTGGLGFASWQLGLRGVFIGASTQRTLGRYEDVASVTANPNPRLFNSNLIDSGFYQSSASPRVARTIDRVTMGIPFEKLNASLALSFTNIERDNRERSQLLGLTYSQTFRKHYNTYISAYADLADRRHMGVIAGLSFTIGQGLIAQSAASLTRESRTASVELSRPMGSKEHDYGWRIYDSEGTSSSRGASGTYRGPWARAGAGVRQESNLVGGYGELDGAIVMTPSGVFATQRVNDAFAVVNVGTAGVEVLHENRVIGRTGWLGKLVVPDAQSFLRTKIAISPETLPGEHHASITETDIIPGFRGSSTVNVKAIAAQDSARIEIRDVKGTQISAGSRATHEETGHVYTIGYGGLTYIPEIGDRNTLVIRSGMAECRATFSRADRNPETGSIGPLTCR